MTRPPLLLSGPLASPWSPGVAQKAEGHHIKPGIPQMESSGTKEPGELLGSPGAHAADAALRAKLVGWGP